MPRELHDGETTWSLVQAYAGLETDSDERPDVTVNSNEPVEVIATPSGGAQTVRLQLKGDWEKALSDEELIKEIAANQK